LPFETNMYCPECGEEYRPGFQKCSDCQVPLVSERPRRTRNRATVLESGDIDLLLAAAEYLEELGIAASIWPGEPGDALPADELGSVVPGRLEVPAQRGEEARTLLDSVDLQSLLREADEDHPPPNPDLELSTLFEGDNPLQLASIKSALRRAGIPFYVEGEELAIRLVPIGPIIHPWCRVQVACDRLAEAVAAIEPFAARNPEPGG